MAQSGIISKRIFVTASPDVEKNTFMGSLIYRTGLELTILERLEKARRTRYDQIIPYMREKQIEPNFHILKNYCTFVEDASTADAVTCLLSTAVGQDEVVKVLQAPAIDTAFSYRISPMFFIDNMRQLGWHQSSYGNAVAGITGALKALYNGNASIFVLISSTTEGDNLLDISTNSPWHSAQESDVLTLVQAID